jgi:hypothetical protein
MDLEHFKEVEGLPENKLLERYNRWVQHGLDIQFCLVKLIEEKTKNLPNEVQLEYGDDNTFQYLLRYRGDLYVGCAFEDSCAFSYKLDNLHIDNLVALLNVLNRPENSHLWVDNMTNKE